MRAKAWREPIVGDQGWRSESPWRAAQPEDLTSAPEPVIQRIIAGCGLAWDDACLRPERNPRAVKTPSKWQTRQPIYRNSVERWRHYEPWLGPLRALLDGASESEPNAAGRGPTADSDVSG